MKTMTQEIEYTREMIKAANARATFNWEAYCTQCRETRRVEKKLATLTANTESLMRQLKNASWHSRLGWLIGGYEFEDNEES
jgi:hypothetical protein